MIQERGSVTFVSKNGEEIIGQVELKLTQLGYGYISRMFVAESSRRKGVATSLMNAILARYGDIRLELIASNHPGDTETQILTEFYSRFGFKFGPSANTARNPRESDSRRMFRDPNTAITRRSFIQCVFSRITRPRPCR